MKTDGAYCPKCNLIFDDTTCLCWPWPKSQALHEKGMGHRMKRFRRGDVDWLLWLYCRKFQLL
jgi:hypothetical protein